MTFSDSFFESSSSSLFFHTQNQMTTPQTPDAAPHPRRRSSLSPVATTSSPTLSFFLLSLLVLSSSGLPLDKEASASHGNIIRDHMVGAAKRAEDAVAGVAEEQAVQEEMDAYLEKIDRMEYDGEFQRENNES